MNLPDTNKIQTLIDNIGMIDINNYSNLEPLNKYIKKLTKNVSVCLHPSGSTHIYHTHDFYEINFVYEGDCINLVEGEKIYMKAGDLLLMSPGTFHTVYAETQSTVVNILIRPSFFHHTFLFVEEDENSLLSVFISKTSDKTHYKYVMCEAECIIGEIADLLQEEATNYPNADIVQASTLSYLICKLLRNETHAIISGIQNASSNTVMRILEYINESYASVTLTDISNRFGYTPAHICRLLLTHTEKTFGKIVTEIRLNKAIEYLRDTNLKIYEISELLGYNSHEYFQRLFKSHFGVTPLQYRGYHSKDCLSITQLPQK